MLKKRAQSTMEYIIILSAITAAIILFATSTLKEKIGTAYNHSIDQVKTLTDELFK